MVNWPKHVVKIKIKLNIWSCSTEFRHSFVVFLNLRVLMSYIYIYVYIYDISSLRFNDLTLIVLMWKKW